MKKKKYIGQLVSVKFKDRKTPINLKGLQPTAEEIIPLTDLETILTYLTDNFGVFQVYTTSEVYCYLGRLKTIDVFGNNSIRHFAID